VPIKAPKTAPVLLKPYLIIGAILLTAAIVYSKGKKSHDFDKTECTLCHGAGAIPQKSETYTGLTAKCMSCHTTLYDKGYMHPVDIMPKTVRVPLDFPLSPTGTLTCATCHDVHTDAETPYGKKSFFLRRYEKGKTFCDICHQNTTKLATGHAAVFREAHFDSKYIADDLSSDIDSMSRNCLSCHDGAIGSSVKLNAGQWREFMGHDNSTMHSIGMKYRDVVHQNQKAMLKPLESVDKRIRFFEDGKVGCGSCHDPYSTIPKQLVIEDLQSKLCFACHLMDGRKQ
jgi:predicted CXXCH cytochrome family protein